MRKRIDYCLVRHAGFPRDTRESKHANAIREKGYTIDVLCLREKGQSTVEEIRGINVYRMPLSHKRGGAIGYIVEYGISFVIMSTVLLYRFIRYRYKVVQVSTMPDFLVFVAFIPKLFGAKVLLDLHEPTPELWLTKFGERKGFFFWIQAKLEQWSIRFAHRCITVTETLRKRFGERGADISKISIVSNVCNDQIFTPGEDKLTVRDPNRFTLITHGLIDERVGHETVIDAVMMLRDKVPGIHFEIPGQGEHEEKLKQYVRDRGCDDLVTFLGYMPFQDLLRKLREADAGVVAMLRNPYSELIDTNKMYEYISMKKPVIASRLMGVEANFDDSCVMLFEPGNAEELAKCILKLYETPELSKSLVENAFERMQQKNSWDKSRTTLLNVIEDLAGPPSFPNPT